MFPKCHEKNERMTVKKTDPRSAMFLFGIFLVESSDNKIRCKSRKSYRTSPETNQQTPLKIGDPLRFRRFLCGNTNQFLGATSSFREGFFRFALAEVASLPDAADALMLGVLMPPPEFLMASVCADLSEHLCHGPNKNVLGKWFQITLKFSGSLPTRFLTWKRMFGILGYKGERMLEDGESLFSFSEI